MGDLDHTSRGFGIIRFTDANGALCTIQESSRMDAEGLIWFGCKEIGLKRFEPGIGWSDVPTPSRPEGVSYVANNRMHLTQSQVQELLPLLTYFAEHGVLPNTDQ